MVEEPAGLDEETLAHFEHTPEFITTCLIVNEPPHFLQILAIVWTSCTASLSQHLETWKNSERRIVQGYRLVTPGCPPLSPQDNTSLKETDVT